MVRRKKIYSTNIKCKIHVYHYTNVHINCIRKGAVTPITRPSLFKGNNSSRCHPNQMLPLSEINL